MQFAYAHTDGTPAGVPKTYCEDVAGDTGTHDYGAPSSGFVIFFSLDASVPPCPYSPEWDGHYEFAHGGGWPLACETLCGATGTGGGSLLCWETYADHAEFPTVTVVDNALSTAGLPVSFSVYTDQLNNVPSVDPAEPDCGDFESDYGTDCVDSCTIPFGASLDGSYQVYVQGTSGHVFADGGGGSTSCVDGTHPFSLVAGGTTSTTTVKSNCTTVRVTLNSGSGWVRFNTASGDCGELTTGTTDCSIPSGASSFWIEAGSNGAAGSWVQIA